MFANYINTPNPSSPSSSSAGPSRSRPTPTRTLRQPHSLSVAQRDHSGALDPSSVSDVAAYEQAMRRKVELRRKGDKWAERLSEGVVDEDEFRRGCRYLEPHHLLSLTHERHLLSLCSYPPCPHAPRAKWKSTQSVRISLRRASIQDTQGRGNAHAGYCSAWCEARGANVERQLQEAGGVWMRGKGWVVELLDDVMERDGRVKVGLGKGEGEEVGGKSRVEAAADEKGETDTNGNGVDGDRGGQDAIGSAGGMRRGSSVSRRRHGAEGVSGSTPPDRSNASRADHAQGTGADMQIVERPTAPNPTAPSLSGPRPSDRPIPLSTSAQSNADPSPRERSAGAASPAPAVWNTSSPNRPISTSIPAHPPSSASPSSSTRIAHASAPSMPQTSSSPRHLPAASRSALASAASRREYGLAPPTSLTSEIMAASKLGTIGARIAQAEQAGTGTAGVHGRSGPDHAETASAAGSEEERDESTDASAKNAPTSRKDDADANPLDKAVRVPQWVQEMSFGPEDEDDEIKRLFEEMRMGQEIMRAQDTGDS